MAKAPRCVWVDGCFQENLAGCLESTHGVHPDELCARVVGHAGSYVDGN